MAAISEQLAFKAVMKAIEDWAEPLSAQTVGLITKDSFKGNQIRIQLAWRVIEAVQGAVCDNTD